MAPRRKLEYILLSQHADFAFAQQPVFVRRRATAIGRPGDVVATDHGDRETLELALLPVSRRK
jgi:hypothetical protein